MFSYVMCEMKSDQVQKDYIHNTPTQRAAIHIRPKLIMNAGNFIGERGLVKPSAGCSFVGIYEVEMQPDSFWSQINLYFVLICLECPLMFLVVMKLMADWLSE